MDNNNKVKYNDKWQDTKKKEKRQRTKDKKKDKRQNLSENWIISSFPTLAHFLDYGRKTQMMNSQIPPPLILSVGETKIKVRCFSGMNLRRHSEEMSESLLGEDCINIEREGKFPFKATIISVPSLLRNIQRNLKIDAGLLCLDKYEHLNWKQIIARYKMSIQSVNNIAGHWPVTKEGVFGIADKKHLLSRMLKWKAADVWIDFFFSENRDCFFSSATLVALQSTLYTAEYYLKWVSFSLA